MAYGILDYLVILPLKNRVNKVTGLENIPKNDNFIVAPYHSFTGDSTYVISTLFPIIKSKIHFIVGESVWKIYNSKIQNFLGMIPHEKGNGKKSLDLAGKVLENGGYVGIFPEGKLMKKGLTKGKTGTANLAIKYKKPVIPVGIYGPSNSASQKLSAKEFIKIFFNSHPIELNFGKPIKFEEYYNKPITKDILDNATEKIMKEIGNLMGIEYKY